MMRRNEHVSWVLFSVSIVCSLLLFSTSRASILDDRKEYIVYMGDRPKDATLASNLYSTMVKTVLGSAVNENSILYEYKRSFSGFVVKLNRFEAKIMRKMKGVVSVYPNEKHELHTTRSWEFMGLPLTVDRSPLESDVIVGVIDSGAWPESESFNDFGIGPPPARWKGTCGPYVDFKCNNKLIGAMHLNTNNNYGPEDVQSPRDSEGHGTHTASTAAGNFVNSVSLQGFGLGTARGGVPFARIAVYKVCWIGSGCSDANVLAGFEHAIADGVDIISISIGSSLARPFFEDASAIGSFHAMRSGILTSMSGGNNGPNPYTVSNLAPWVVTVAASTIDRTYSTKVLLGNNDVYVGISINTIDISNAMYPLVYGGDIPNVAGGYDSTSSRFCSPESLDPAAVAGKIILCDTFEYTGAPVFWNGAMGIIMTNDSHLDTPQVFPLAAAQLGTPFGASVRVYAQTTTNPTATILRSTEIGDAFAPTVASFSARGPNRITPDIIKPDITAPGVSILAAFPPLLPISEVKGDGRNSPYNFMFGTSMACPHISGIAAFIKSYNPAWSPAAIKSAIMTTSTPMTGKNLESLEFAYGSGHLTPLAALNPGLVYDIVLSSYISFLCGQGYTNTELLLVTQDPTLVCIPGTETKSWDLNYPSFGYAAAATETLSLSRTFTRTVTNVGPAISTYTATVNLVAGLAYKVEPPTLFFTSYGQSLTYQLTILGSIAPLTMAPGSLVWDDGVHKVRSPIVIWVP